MKLARGVQMEERRINRNVNLDILKAVCCFLVVCIHAPFPGKLGDAVITFARIAVPVFFMISGYFYNRANLDKQIRKVGKLVVQINLLYFSAGGGYELISKESFRYGFDDFVEFILFNESPFYSAGHLWYMNALLYVLIVLKMIDIKYLCPFAPVLLLGDLLLGKYSYFVFGTEFPYYYARNFLFVGIPYFCLGYLIRTVNLRLKPKICLLLSILVAFANLIEKKVLIDIGCIGSREHYFFTTILAVLILICALNSKCAMDNCVAVIGRSYSSQIYVLHPLVMVFWVVVSERLGIYGYMRIFYPTEVFITTLCVVIVFNRVKRMVNCYCKILKKT